ncbi:MAG: hypothetical protein OMM_06831 [Candidatus Magnetoglobus multicellularis str. Araruama]|uniref:HEPN domain-containing protein n=1 Tax=Candidatus Magnetoglobus multicellularis str. Araruama TaxID=890399 RepID=A0A1V1PG21_9BACT|nr:MAG: hypothetical protein OMM_06831 [Candidatus Magnetoglobus multicellularis str. Araruama]
MKGKTFTANDYYSASKSRLQDLEYLRGSEANNIFALYCSGVLIECMLRAYILTYTKEFDSKHDLEKLYIKSQLGSQLTEDEKGKLSASIKIANKIWSNDLRYCSEKRLKRIFAHEFVKMKYKPKNINKYISNKKAELFEIAKEIQSIGEEKWKY